MPPIIFIVAFLHHDSVDSDSRLENTRWLLEGDTFGKEKYATDILSTCLELKIDVIWK